GDKVPRVLINVSPKYFRDASDAKEKLTADLERILSNVPARERPAEFTFVVKSFSPESGELTSNLKLRRNHVLSNFAPHDRKLTFPSWDMKKDNFKATP